MKKIKLITFAALASLALPAFSNQLYGQRSCVPDDLHIGYNGIAQTQCEWMPKDDVSLQVTLHTEQDIHLIDATCIFTPSTATEGNEQDKVVAVVGHKAAEIKNLSIKNNVINFEVYNDNSDPNLNVVFYLKNKDFAAGNKIHCTFADA